MATNPLAIDLYCGLGGWTEALLAEGWDVIGFDIQNHRYPGTLVLQDVRTLHGSQFKTASLIVASPPCEEFSRHDQPWTRAKNPPQPDLSMWQAAERIQREASAASGRYIPMVVENVRGAQKFIGPATAHFGKQYLWGDVPAILPPIVGQNFGRQKQSLSSTAKTERAKIPQPLAQHIARVFKPYAGDI